MTSAELSEAMALLLLLIDCSLLPSLLLLLLLLCACEGGGGMVGPCYVVHYLDSSFAIISLKKKGR